MYLSLLNLAEALDHRKASVVCGVFRDAVSDNKLVARLAALFPVIVHVFESRPGVVRLDLEIKPQSLSRFVSSFEVSSHLESNSQVSPSL